MSPNRTPNLYYVVNANGEVVMWSNAPLRESRKADREAIHLFALNASHPGYRLVVTPAP